jgi:hypothetical protein
MPVMYFANAKIPARPATKAICSAQYSHMHHRSKYTDFHVIAPRTRLRSQIPDQHVRTNYKQGNTDIQKNDRHLPNVSLQQLI